MFQVGNLRHLSKNRILNFPRHSSQGELPKQPLENLLSPYPDFKKNNSTFLMFPKTIYRSGNVLDLPPPFEIRVASPATRTYIR